MEQTRPWALVPGWVSGCVTAGNSCHAEGYQMSFLTGASGPVESEGVLRSDMEGKTIFCDLSCIRGRSGGFVVF